jgi:hypothetical protein
MKLAAILASALLLSGCAVTHTTLGIAGVGELDRLSVSPYWGGKPLSVTTFAPDPWLPVTLTVAGLAIVAVAVGLLIWRVRWLSPTSSPPSGHGPGSRPAQIRVIES